MKEDKEFGKWKETVKIGKNYTIKRFEKGFTIKSDFLTERIPHKLGTNFSDTSDYINAYYSNK